MSLLQKYGIIGLSLLLIFPAILSFNHVFAHDFEISCNDYNTTHFHENRFDCELCNIHPTPIIGAQLISFDQIETPLLNKSFVDTYKFLSNYQKLSFALRGPPASNQS